MDPRVKPEGDIKNAGGVWFVLKIEHRQSRLDIGHGTMHPAYSIIFFTTASGAGYGLLALLCLFGALGLLPAERWLGLVGFAIAFLLITAGLVASSWHLGHPERAWRAFSQWRSSWLSREGVMAVVTYIPSGLFAAAWVFAETTDGIWALLGLLSVLLAAITVCCTAMIYASLKTIRQWHNPLVLPGYLALALMSGSLWLNLLASLFGVGSAGFLVLALVAIGLGAGIKLATWRRNADAKLDLTTAQATGLTRFGTVRQVEAPHSQANYLMREMGHQVARKHARKLRSLAVTFAFALPFGLSLLALVAPAWLAGLAMLLAVASASFGLLIERWLFFAEAQHVVTLYYGAEAA